MSQPPVALPSLGELHDEQIVALLRSGAHATLLNAYFGDVAYRELCQLARLAAIRRDSRGPLIYILPGIMGSRLGSVRRKATSLIWLHPKAIAAGELLRLALPGSRTVRAVGVMLPGYLKLKLSLESAGFNPVFHPFDWRDDLRRLGRAFMATVERSAASKVMVVAHSMGGLVARAALTHDKHQRIAKVIQLGAPNHGSFAPVQAFRAVYPTVRKIAALDRSHSAEELARAVFRTLPGLYQLLPSPEHSDADLFDARAWPDDDLAPNQTLLQQARKSRASLAAADARCFAITGTNQETITSTVVRDAMFEYTIRSAGDGTVPLSLSGWPGARTWYAEENHGALTNHNVVLAAINDLLRSDQTARLPDTPPAVEHRIVRRVNDQQLRAEVTHKVRWDALSADSRRRILDPVISPEFRGATLQDDSSSG